MTKTAEQIASEMNVSVTTVRLVLNGKAQRYRISHTTQSRIHEYVARYGYSVNHSARSLKLNKTETLGLIIPCLSNVFFATLAEKLELRCREFGLQLTISCSYNDMDYENKLVNTLTSRNVDGLFIVPSSFENQMHHLKQVKKPLVLLDRGFNAPLNALVESDNFSGASMLTQSMLEAGKTPLWFLVGDTQLPSIHQRLQGYCHAFTHSGWKEQGWVLEASGNTPEGGEQLMRQIITSNGVPQAFIASSLPVLEGALKVIRHHCGEIPHHINIGTFDEHPMLGFLSNNVWSVQQDENSWAEKAFELMQLALDGHPVQHVERVNMKLIKRNCKV